MSFLLFSFIKILRIRGDLKDRDRGSLHFAHLFSSETMMLEVDISHFIKINYPENLYPMTLDSR